MGPQGGFEPIDGDKYMYSQRADVSYKRLSRTLDLTGGGTPSLSFRTSYDTEAAWDHVFVEVHTVGQDNWTTLPDTNGHTTTETGESCANGWFELHPWLERYQGADCSGTNPTTGGAWNGASGRSDGWETWNIDLSALRRPAGRGLDHLRQRLGHPGRRHLRRRDRRLDG